MESDSKGSSVRQSEMQVYESYAEKLSLEVLLDIICQNKENKGIKSKNLRNRKTATIWKSVSVDWLQLPQEIWLSIFSYLSLAELYFIVHKVCKTFNAWSRDILLWKVIDFHKMRLDMTRMRELGLKFIPAKISASHLCHILTVFHDHITSIKMSRFGNDCGLEGTTLANLCNCSSITKLDLGFCAEIDMSTIVKQCSKIEELNVEGSSGLTDQDFADIHHLKNLRKLCVSHCAGLTDDFLVHLYNLSNLRELISDGVMHLSEQGLISFMHKQPLMEVLVLDGEDMMDDLVCFAAANLPNLRAFELSFSQSLTNRSISSFDGKYSIESLKFRKCPEITAPSLCKLFCKGSTFSLKYFTVTECEGITDEVLANLSRRQFLMVDWCWQISDQGLCEVVNNCKNLSSVSIVGLFGIRGDGWLANLEERLPYLRFLDASDCNHMPDEDLVDLVCRKRTLEVYTYYHDRVLVPTVTPEQSDTSDEDWEDEKREWTCPGERGVEVVF